MVAAVAWSWPAGGEGGGVVGRRSFSCSTNSSNDVLDRLRLAKLGSAAMAFCLYLHRRTFGDAGYHRKHGQDETACEFDLARWSAEIPNDKSNVRRIRRELEACRIIRFAPDSVTPGRGIIAWNTAYDEWLPYDGRRVMRERDQRSSPCPRQNQLGMVISPDRGNITMLGSCKITTVASSKQPYSPAENRDEITTAASLNEGEITTLGSLGMGSEAGPAIGLRKDTEEEPDAILASGSGAGATALPPVAPVSPGSTVKKSTKHSSARKLTDEQLEAHQAEQQWCREVLDELARRLDVKVVPRAGQQKAAAKWLYGELTGVEDGQRRLWQCYDLTKRSPFWQGKTLLLSDLVRPFPEYRRDPAGYRAAIERECDARKQREESARYGHSWNGTDRRGAAARGSRYGASSSGRQSYTGGNGYERPGGPKFGTPEYYEDGRRRMAEEAARANGLAG